MLTAALFLLDLAGDRPERLWALLDHRERAYAARYRFAIDRDRFVARRGQLRLFLAELTGATPSTIRYEIGNHGKPTLAGHDDLHFSTSNAGAMGLCVASDESPIGCDIARHETVSSDLAIARRLFAPAEYAYLSRLPPADRRHAFVEIWTRKEAIVKAIGQGLHYPLDAFDVAAGGGGQDISLGDEGTWRIEPLTVGSGYLAAVASRDPAVRVGLTPSIYLPGRMASSLAPLGDPHPVQASQPALAA